MSKLFDKQAADKFEAHAYFERRTGLVALQSADYRAHCAAATFAINRLVVGSLLNGILRATRFNRGRGSQRRAPTEGILLRGPARIQEGSKKLHGRRLSRFVRRSQ